ncbi:hypothetical protein [Rhodococcus sp. 24CO]|uniref:hypothetical protein n=1 Tax=Rhodococcus sp. 24CO TaxID=3117460 RepID=UPI003D335B86
MHSQPICQPQIDIRNRSGRTPDTRAESLNELGTFHHPSPEHTQRSSKRVATLGVIPACTLARELGKFQRSCSDTHLLRKRRCPTLELISSSVVDIHAELRFARPHEKSDGP